MQNGLALSGVFRSGGRRAEGQRKGELCSGGGCRPGRRKCIEWSGGEGRRHWDASWWYQCSPVCIHRKSQVSLAPEQSFWNPPELEASLGHLAESGCLHECIQDFCLETECRSLYNRWVHSILNLLNATEFYNLK